MLLQILLLTTFSYIFVYQNYFIFFAVKSCLSSKKFLEQNESVSFSEILMFLKKLQHVLRY